MLPLLQAPVSTRSPQRRRRRFHTFTWQIRRLVHPYLHQFVCRDAVQVQRGAVRVHVGPGGSPCVQCSLDREAIREACCQCRCEKIHFTRMQKDPQLMAAQKMTWKELGKGLAVIFGRSKFLQNPDHHQISTVCSSTNYLHFLTNLIKIHLQLQELICQQSLQRLNKSAYILLPSRQRSIQIFCSLEPKEK